ncbi:hypothetical protein C5B78_09230 [Aeromonas salmonicida]|nr:hypothetical protein C5B78_09230 [Aeromonas salmonicida]
MIAIVLAMLKMLPVGDQDVSKGLAGKIACARSRSYPGWWCAGKQQEEEENRGKSGRHHGGLVPDRG